MENNAQLTPGVILNEALPYIIKYHNQVVVIKYGGAAMTSPETMELVVENIALLRYAGIKIILVHGGGKDIDEYSARLGLEKRSVNSFRYTDAEIMELVQMVLVGKLNTNLTAQINRRLTLLGSEPTALGLSGIDAGIIKAKELDDGSDYGGYVGQVVDVRAEPLLDFIERGYIPVIPSVAAAVDRDDVDHGSMCYNINADVAACEIAIKLKAKKVIFMTDTPGLLRDFNDRSTRIPLIRLSDLSGLRSESFFDRGMIPKIDSAERAVRNGVESATILDGGAPHALLVELLTDKGEGTMVTA